MGTVPRGDALENFERSISEAVLNRLEEKLSDIPFSASFEEAWLRILDACPEYQTVINIYDVVSDTDA